MFFQRIRKILLVHNYISLTSGFSAGGRVFEYMNLEPSIPLHSGGKTIPFYSLFGDVEFRNVSFTYPTRPHQVVLDDLSLKIPAGHMVALVGSRYVKTQLAYYMQKMLQETNASRIYFNASKSEKGQ